MSSSFPSLCPKEKSIDDYAKRIWNGDNTVYYDLDHVLEWIADGKPTNDLILHSYMSNFEFKDLTLEQAFRYLCSKLSMRGETQQIDRVLVSFSRRYHERNPNSIYGSPDMIHAIVYSVLLLNTDLHVAQGDHKRMTRSEFIKNTMSTMYAQLDLVAATTDTTTPLARTPSNTSGISTSTYTSSSIDTRHCIPGSVTWQYEMKNLLKQLYTNIRHTQINNSYATLSPSSSNRMSTAFRRGVGTIIWKSSRDSVLGLEDTSSIQSHDSAMPSIASTTKTKIDHQHAPYYKEGITMRKHLLEKSDQKARHRDWKECWMQVESDQLYMYKTDCYRKKADLMGVIDLKHTLANVLPSGYSRSRPFAFALQQNNGAIHLFQVGSAEQVQEWVETCNYWAACSSKAPFLGEGVSSMEYGWGDCLFSTKKITTINDWEAPTPMMSSSTLDEAGQLSALTKYVQGLNTELDDHRDIKPRMESYFQHHKLKSKAMSNWEAKSQYLLHETIKYQNYCNSLEASLSNAKKGS